MAETGFSELFDRYYNGTADEAAIQAFQKMLIGGEHDRELEELLRDRWQQDKKNNPPFDLTTRERMLEHIFQQRKEKVRKMYRLRRALSVAAILTLIAGGYYYFQSNEKKNTPTNEVVTHDIAPGRMGAVVKLSNGQEVMLDTVSDGVVAMDGTVRVIKENGQLKYEGIADEIKYNETSTGRGRSWPVVLPDGSIVWLNTSSSIRYPLTFTGKERRVQMTGECYFEVKHDDKIPFRVELSGGIVIEDVGTAFNIRSYSDEATQKTTVIEGIVNVNAKTAPYLKYTVGAGRQAIAANGKLLHVIPAENMDEITAWRENRFRFKKAELRWILQEASRWYDMEVEYLDEVRDAYTVSISRNVPLSSLLNYIEQSGGVHFKIEGKKVFVSR